jgi:hypothetical protein
MIAKVNIVLIPIQSLKINSIFIILQELESQVIIKDIYQQDFKPRFNLLKFIKIL